MRAIVEIPKGEPFTGTQILTLETAPQVGHYIGDANGRLYRIEKVVHLLTRNEEAGYPFLKLIVQKETT
ncbi:hypothetical protein SAMN02745166_03095 [Prosthecobacter debontii]|uniref:Uncharacterized protein n=1 Tax=Prosthecobacter debontii TaxID=48467 RepID=A0A1T4YF78_9BACT|nr:hypothetical protein [Prosthecobacter debontii]SKB00208.1 hypothetical protein SAMN02745166_03095 [Prosthecobacter debontii]